MSRPSYGTRILGSGSAVPEGVLTNADLEKILNTNDEWITQRTGIKRRHKCNPDKGESNLSLCTLAIERALEDAKIDVGEIDLLIVATVTGAMTCPSTACRVANNIGLTNVGAFDVLAACSGFVYAMNIGASLIESGHYKTIAVIGCDTLTDIADYTSRNVSILLGDAAGAVILRRDDEDPEAGLLHQTMGSDGRFWEHLYIPRNEVDVPEGADWNEVKLDYLQMNGREVYKFALTTFQRIVKQVMDEANLGVDDLKMLIPHQSNLRIIDSTKERLKLPDEKVAINIQEYGNSSSGSVALCFDQMWRSGQIGRGDTVLLVAFGGGLTWASSLWRL